jgi:transcriptional regulator with XRE-family HTH domain
LSQKAVAQASRNFQEAVSEIELGRRNAKYEALYRIAAVLEMHLLPINAPFSGKVAEMMMGDSFCAQPPASKVGTAIGSSLQITI